MLHQERVHFLPSHASHSRKLTLGLCIVVGQEELDDRSVNVRNRDDVGTKAKTAMIPLDTIIKKLVKLNANKSLQNTLPE